MSRAAAAAGDDYEDPFDAIMAPSKSEAQTAGAAGGSSAPATASPQDFTDPSSMGLSEDSWGTPTSEGGGSASTSQRQLEAPGATDPGSMLGLATLRTVRYPGSSVPFEKAVRVFEASKPAASRGKAAKLDLPDEEIITTRSDSVSVLDSGDAKDFHHRYPQFTTEDLDEAFRATRRRWHGVTRWTRLYEEGESLSEQEEGDAEAIMQARHEAEAAIARGETSSIPIVRMLSSGEEMVAPDDNAPANEVLDFHRFDQRTGADIVAEEQRLRQQVRDAAARGDSAEVDRLTKVMEERLGGRPEPEELDQLHRNMQEEHALYHRRVGRFVDAVYGSGSRDEGNIHDIVNDADMWDPSHPRDETGELPVKQESLFSLDRILSERDPLRKRFLDKHSEKHYGHAAADHAGLGVGYCIFCAHGHGEGSPGGQPLMREDNTLLLSRFISPDGRILPRRFTGVCSKHQRHLSRTIKRSRSLNLLPFQRKLHPSLRFTQMEPDPVTEPAKPKTVRSMKEKDTPAGDTKRAEGAAELDAALDELQSMLDADAALASTLPMEDLDGSPGGDGDVRA